ncbi:MAG: UTP--glucose-1-phosphate uridylyltransferase GalU [Acidimicrobiales bacterium]
MTSRVTKAVIPAAGLGTRFLPATKAIPKEMLPLVDKPAIQYVVEEAVSVGLTDVLIVTGRNKSTIDDHFDRAPELERHLETGGKKEELAQVQAIAELAEVHFVRQGEARGLGHAVGVARRHVGDEPFAVLLGDDIMDARVGVLAGMLRAFEQRGSSVVALLPVPEDHVSLYGCAAVDRVDGSGNLVRLRNIVEKPDPDEAPSDLAVMGRYVFTPAIFDEIERTAPGKGGEIQLTDAIRLLLARQDVYGYTFREGRFDVGNKLDYLRATVELALEREDLGPAFREWLVDYLGRA